MLNCKFKGKETVVYSGIKKAVPQKQPTPLPRWELFLIWVIHASQGFQTTMLFPMLVFMVEHYKVGDRGQASVGQYSGILASLFPLAQFCTSVLWGTISDRTGRKPWLAFGNAVSATSSLLLGTCKTYFAACTIRFLGGLLNGTLTMTKSMVGELCDGSNQAKGFGILNLAWGIGSMAGPVISGLLAQPCTQYKIQKCPRFLVDYPFLLPCIAATICSCSAILAALSLKETSIRKLSYKKLPTSLAELDDNLPHETCMNDLLSAADNYEEDTGSSPCSRTLDIRPPISQSELKIEVQEARDIVALELEQFISQNLSQGNDPELSKSILKDKGVLLSSLCYSLTGLIFIIADELFPIFGAASTSVGGLDFHSSAIGLILGVGGVVLFLYTLLAYPRVAKRIGPLYCFRCGLALSVPLWIMFPISSIIPGKPKLQVGFLLLVMAVKSMIACTTFTGVLILVSNSASPANMGAVTGLSHSFASFFRAVGPAFGGFMWTYATRLAFPFHQFVAWWFVSALSLLTFGISFLLPPSLIQPKGCLEGS